MQSHDMPEVFLNGDRDPFATPEQLTQEAGAEPKRLIPLHHAHYFSTGHLEPTEEAITDWLKEQVQ